MRFFAPRTPIQAAPSLVFEFTPTIPGSPTPQLQTSRGKHQSQLPRVFNSLKREFQVVLCMHMRISMCVSAQVDTSDKIETPVVNIDSIISSRYVFKYTLANFLRAYCGKDESEWHPSSPCMSSTTSPRLTTRPAWPRSRWCMARCLCRHFSLLTPGSPAVSDRTRQPARQHPTSNTRRPVRVCTEVPGDECEGATGQSFHHRRQNPPLHAPLVTPGLRASEDVSQVRRPVHCRKDEG